MNGDQRALTVFLICCTAVLFGAIFVRCGTPERLCISESQVHHPTVVECLKALRD